VRRSLFVVDLFEILYCGAIFKNEDFKEVILGKRVADSTYKSMLNDNILG
jgi:hypothetical protein